MKIIILKDNIRGVYQACWLLVNFNLCSFINKLTLVIFLILKKSVRLQPSNVQGGRGQMDTP